MFRFRVWTMAVAVALPALAGAQAVDPEQSFNSGLNHLREGRATLAVEEFKKAVRQDAEEPVFPEGARPGLCATHKFDEAIAAFRKALELNPYYVDVRNDLGTALILSGTPRRGQGGVHGRLQRAHQPHARDLVAQPRPGLPGGEELSPRRPTGSAPA